MGLALPWAQASKGQRWPTRRLGESEVPEAVEGWGRDPGPRGEEGGTGRGCGGTGAWGGWEAGRGRSRPHRCQVVLGTTWVTSASVQTASGPCCDSELARVALRLAFFPAAAPPLCGPEVCRSAEVARTPHTAPPPRHSFQPVCLSESTPCALICPGALQVAV